MRKINISQSLIKEVEKEGCIKAVQHFLDGTDTEPSDAMFAGLYFEHHLIGGCRGGQVPEFKALKSGAKPKAQTDLDELIERSKMIMAANEIVIDEVQPEYKFDDVVAHLDAVGSIRGKKCLIDVKWTATREDDRWNGWGNPSEKEEAHIQAVHYVWTYWMSQDEKLPFYFIVFGKSGWVKLIRFDISDNALLNHRDKIGMTRHRVKDMINKGFDYIPHYGQCSGCRYKNVCQDFTYKLEEEQLQLL